MSIRWFAHHTGPDVRVVRELDKIESVALLLTPEPTARWCSLCGVRGSRHRAIVHERGNRYYTSAGMVCPDCMTFGLLWWGFPASRLRPPVRGSWLFQGMATPLRY